MKANTTDKISPMMAACALTVVATGKTPAAVVFAAGLKSESAELVAAIVASMSTAEMYAALPPMRRSQFSQFAPK